MSDSAYDDNWEGTGMRMRDWMRLPMAEKLRRAIAEQSNAMRPVLRRAFNREPRL
ncbi:hypothetical protein EDF59_1449 [Novosphingobium sp. ST904]|nr:hypothetical protein EDF59_1449 [Novosphingobium sp. ST904]